MSKLSQLQGQPKKYKIGEIELELKPLGLDDIENFAIGDNATPQEQSKASINMIKATLRRSYPDATEQEISDIDIIKHMEELMNAITDVNGMGKGQSQTSRMKDVIATRQTQAKSQGK